VVGPTLTFDGFFRTEMPGLMALARALCGDAAAERVAQEAMLAARGRWDRVVELASPERWVRRVCARTASSWARRMLVQAKAAARLAGPESVLAPMQPRHEAFWADTRRLPRRQAQVVALSYVFDLGVADVAAVLGFAEDEARRHLQLARQTLGDQVARDGGDAARNLERLARDATADLQDTTRDGYDVDVLLRGLGQLRRRRRSAYAGTAAGTAVVVVAAWLGTAGVFGPGPAPPPPRIDNPRNGALVFAAGATQAVHGSVRHLPAASPYSDFSWSPNGVWLAYDAAGRLQTMNVRTGEVRVLLGCRGCTFAWSPTGARIAVADLHSLRLVDVANRSTVPIPLPSLSQVREPTWAPDGERLAFLASGPEGRGVYAADVDGADLRLLWRASGHEWHQRPGETPVDVSWSPDGSVIAFIDGTALRYGPLDNRRLSVRSVLADGSGDRLLHTIGTCFCVGFVPGITWSPDGQLIAVDSINAPINAVHIGLFEMNPDGSHMRWIGTGGNGALAWQPRHR
jgi:RNA polymerase sigma-70 factor (ECF subfamily)